MDAEKIGKAIKILRKKAGYTQKELSKCLEVTDKAVSKWERGLGVPDISIITKLSILLNCDIDNLLEGNISYIESTWQGILIIDDSQSVSPTSKIYGKPLVYLLIGYFLLAGIGNITIVSSRSEQKKIESIIGSGERWGIHISYIERFNIKQLKSSNTMVVYDNPFVYGPNLTKYFQRAMSRKEGISILTIDKGINDSEIRVSYDNYKTIKNKEYPGIKQYCVPIVFVPKEWYHDFILLKNKEDILSLDSLYAEPMGNGMIQYCINDEDTLMDTACFLRFLKNRMGKNIYDLSEIAHNRNFI